MARKNPIIEEVWKSREMLLEEHGGIEGFLKFIKKQEREHPDRMITPEQVKAKRVKF